MLGRAVFQQARENLRGHAAGQQFLQNFVFTGFIVEHGATFFGGFELGGDHLQFGRDLADHAFELRVEHGRDVKLATIKTGQHIRRNVLSVGISKVFHLGQVHMAHKMAFVLTLQLFTTLFADRQDFHRLASLQQCINTGLGQLDDVGVETATKATFGRHHHQKVGLIRSGACQQFRPVFANRTGKTGHDGVELFRVGTRGARCFFRTAEFGSGDHLHRLCDLPGRFDRVDPCFQVLEVGHLPYPFG